MSTSLLIRLGVEPVRTLAFGSISGTYVGIGTALTRPVRMVVFQNLMDKAVMVSFDGIEDHLPLAANGYLILDVTANKTRESGYFIGEGTRFYAKQLNSAPTSESLYVTTFYGDQ